MARKFVLQHLVMTFQARDVVGVAKDQILDKMQKFLSVTALAIERIEKRASHRTIWIEAETNAGYVSFIP